VFEKPESESKSRSRSRDAERRKRSKSGDKKRRRDKKDKRERSPKRDRKVRSPNLKFLRKNVIKMKKKLIDGTAGTATTVARNRKINTKLTATNPRGTTNLETVMLTVTVRSRGTNPVCMRTANGQSQRLG
jgi:hypothetical protein